MGAAYLAVSQVALDIAAGSLGGMAGASPTHRTPQPHRSEGGMIRLETLIELKFLDSSFSSSNL